MPSVLESKPALYLLPNIGLVSLLQVAWCYLAMSLDWGLPRSSGLFPTACGCLPKRWRRILRQYMTEKSLAMRSHKFRHGSTLQATLRNLASFIVVRLAAPLG